MIDNNIQFNEHGNIICMYCHSVCHTKDEDKYSGKFALTHQQCNKCSLIYCFFTYEKLISTIRYYYNDYRLVCFIQKNKTSLIDNKTDRYIITLDYLLNIKDPSQVPNKIQTILSLL